MNSLVLLSYLQTVSKIIIYLYTALCSITYTPVHNNSFFALTAQSSQTFESTVNVCDYGMVGDGSFDNSNILKDLITQHSSLYFPSGRYLFKSEITISNSVSIMGESADSTILLFDYASDNWNLRIKCSGFSASNLSFVLNTTQAYPIKSNIGCTLVKVAASSDCRFNSCVFSCDSSTPYYYTAFWINSDNGPISDIAISNCVFQNTANEKLGGAFWIYGCTYPIDNIYVTANTFIHTGWDENVAIWGQENVPLRNINISNNTIINNNSVITSDNIISVRSHYADSDINICNNIFAAEGYINTGVKLLGQGKILFDSNVITISNSLDGVSNYGFLTILDGSQLDFTNNTISISQSYPYRIKINSINHFKSNSINKTPMP